MHNHYQRKADRIIPILRRRGRTGQQAGIAIETEAAILIDALLMRIALLEARIVHCDNCGSDWVDNGINSGCSCKRIPAEGESADSK